MANHIPVFDGHRVSAGPAQAAIQAVLNDLEALKPSKDLEATCQIWGVNPISIDRPSCAFRCFRLRWLLVEQTWQLPGSPGSNPNWSAIVISSTSIPLVLSMRVKYAASPGRAFVSARPVGLMNSHRNPEGNPKGPCQNPVR